MLGSSVGVQIGPHPVLIGLRYSREVLAMAYSASKPRRCSWKGARRPRSFVWSGGIICWSRRKMKELILSMFSGVSRCEVGRQESTMWSWSRGTMGRLWSSIACWRSW